MTTPTLSDGAGGTINLGVVDAESSRLFRRIIDWNLPTSSSDSTITFGFMGATRLLVINARFSGTEATIKTFIDTIETWVNESGSQDKRTYTDSFAHTYDVRCTDFSWDRSTETPGQIEYTLTMMQTA